MKAVVAAFNQEKALVGAFSVITNVRMELFEALQHSLSSSGCSADGGTVRLPPHPPLALGRVPVQVLRGSRLQLRALQFPVIRGTWQHGMYWCTAAINSVILRSILKEAELDDKEVIKHIEPK